MISGRLQSLKAIESLITHKGKSNVVFLGSIPDGITDELIEHLLGACGNLESWRRMLDPNSAPKSFGFATFMDTDSVCRALWILNSLPILGPKPLLLKVDKGVEEYLQEYQRMVENSGMTFNDEEIYLKSIDECITILKSHNVLSSIGYLNNLKTSSPSKQSFLNDKALKKETSPSSSTNIRDLGSISKEFIISLSKAIEEEWMEEENNILSRLDRHKEASIDRIERFKKNYKTNYERFFSFDESSFKNSSFLDESCPLFYRDRGEWRKMRVKELRKEEKYDLEDMIEEKEIESYLNVLSTDDNSLSFIEESSSHISIKFGHSSKSVIGFGDSLDDLKEKHTKTPNTLLENEVDYSILRDSGLNRSEIESRLYIQNIKKIEVLMSRIPADYHKLLNYSWEKKQFTSLQKDHFFHFAEKYLVLFGFQKEFTDTLLLSLGLRELYEALLKEYKSLSPTISDVEKHIKILSAILWRMIIFLNKATIYGISLN